MEKESSQLGRRKHAESLRMGNYQENGIQENSLIFQHVAVCLGRQETEKKNTECL